MKCKDNVLYNVVKDFMFLSNIIVFCGLHYFKFYSINYTLFCTKNVKRNYYAYHKLNINVKGYLFMINLKRCVRKRAGRTKL